MNQENYEYDVLTPEEREKQEEMRELLLQHFDGKCPLFQIYKDRGWLDRLFTPKILSMDKNMLYSTKEVADICETPFYNINNKRRELIDYVKPKKLGDSSSYKHDYISVFKLKMIVGLTVEEGHFTVTQLKSIIFGNTGPEHHEQTTSPQISYETRLKEYEKKIKRFEEVIEMLTSGELEDEILNMVREEVKKQFKSLPSPNLDQMKSELKDTLDEILKKELETIKQNEKEAKEKVTELYNQILSPETDIETKEELLQSFDKLLIEYPDYAYTINLYKELAEEKVNTFKQDQKELHVKEVKKRVLELFKTYQDNTLPQSVRDNALEQLEQLMLKEKELEFEIRYYVSQIIKERENKKKGFFKRLFSRD